MKEVFWLKQAYRKTSHISSVFCFFPWGDWRLLPGPSELLEYTLKASYVVIIVIMYYNELTVFEYVFFVNI